MTSKDLSELFIRFKEKFLFGRYITNEKIQPALEKIKTKFNVTTIGYSEANKPIVSIDLGTGDKKVLLWSQMHGNESTTTKALFDVLNVFANDTSFNDILDHCTLKIIPILNPDGAECYTRLNVNAVDLNRDAQELSQSESRVLRNVFESFKPNFCFNLHGQRTIFGVADIGVSSSLSFLSPAADEGRTITEARKEAMKVITNIYQNLQDDIPSGIGRYGDAFNINCVGDTFTLIGVPTILYEAGHYPNDYNREETRELIFKALYYGFLSIAQPDSTISYDMYFNIPNIKKNFFDIIIRNVRLSEFSEISDVAIQFKEVLVNGIVEFIPTVAKIGQLNTFYGHKEIKGGGHTVLDQDMRPLKLDNEIVFVMLNSNKILLKS